MTQILSALIGALGAIIAALIVSPSLGKKLATRRRYRILVGSLSILLLVSLAGLIWILLLPSPQAHIVLPNESRDQRAPADVRVVVGYKDIPTYIPIISERRYVWVVVRIPGIPITSNTSTRLVYPQLPGNKLPPQVTGSGSIVTLVHLGGNQDSGTPFNILVLLLNEEANRSFIDYSNNCIQTNACGGIPLPDTGVEILDFVTVIRE